MAGRQAIDMPSRTGRGAATREALWRRISETNGRPAQKEWEKRRYVEKGHIDRNSGNSLSRNPLCYNIFESIRTLCQVEDRQIYECTTAAIALVALPDSSILGPLCWSKCADVRCSSERDLSHPARRVQDRLISTSRSSSRRTESIPHSTVSSRTPQSHKADTSRSRF
jgi:hypothetical protein